MVIGPRNPVRSLRTGARWRRLRGRNLSKEYRKVTLTLVVKASATQQVRSELEEAADLIVADNVVYESFIEDRHSRKPANAAAYEMDEEEEDN